MGGPGSGRKPDPLNQCPGCGKFEKNYRQFHPWHTLCAAKKAFEDWKAFAAREDE